MERLSDILGLEDPISKPGALPWCCWLPRMRKGLWLSLRCWEHWVSNQMEAKVLLINMTNGQDEIKFHC